MTRFGILALLLIYMNPCEGQLKSHWNLRHAAKRLLQAASDRHPTSVIENNENLIDNHPNPVTLRNSFFTAKYCSPDPNGYYGSTMGTPSEIIFGFEAETAPNANVDEVIDSIHESVETALLTTFFPTMCQKGKEPYDSHVTGFHFNPSSVEFVRKCLLSVLLLSKHACSFAWLQVSQPIILFCLLVSEPCQVLEDDGNTCGIYVGSVRVYGEGGDPLDIIKDHLDESGEESIHPQLRRLFSVNTNNQNFVSAPPSTSSEGISSSAIAGVAVALVTLSIGIIGLVAMQTRRRRRRRLSQSGEQEQDCSSESERDESISVETNDDLQMETIAFEPETSLVVSGKLGPRSIIIDPDVLSRGSELL